mgnify:CR=1 FL=1
MTCVPSSEEREAVLESRVNVGDFVVAFLKNDFSGCGDKHLSFDLSLVFVAKADKIGQNRVSFSRIYSFR